MTIEERVSLLEKKVADLEVQAQDRLKIKMDAKAVARSICDKGQAAQGKTSD